MSKSKIKASVHSDLATLRFDICSLLKILIRFLFGSLVFWSLGRFGFSSVWLLFLAILLTCERRFQLLRIERVAFFRDLTQDVRPAIEKRLSELPSWIHYPDMERCEWVNKFVQQMWPTIADFVQKIVKDTIEPEIQKQASGLSFERVDLGDLPPRLGGIKVYTENIRADEIVIDAELFYGGDMQIKMKYHGLKAGIKSLYLHGELRIVLKPLVPKAPLIGALEAFFLRTPTIDFDLTDIANIIEIPGLHNLLMLSLERVLQAFIVLPNRLVIAFMKEIDINQLKFPRPDGILRIDIVEAKNLPKMDVSLLTSGKHAIDAFVTINIGHYKFKTEVNKNLNPKWFETFEFPLEESDIQQLEIAVLDADIGTDEYVGTLTIPIQTIKNKDELIDQWYDLIGAKNSTIHIRMNWFYLSDDRRQLAEIEQINVHHLETMPSKIHHTLSTSVLLVYVERAEELPGVRHGKAMEPHPFCSIKIDNYEEKTPIIKNASNPRWTKSFMFMLVNPEQSILHFGIKDSNSKNRTIGTVDIPLTNLMEEKNWTSNQGYPIKGINSANTRLYVKLQLRIMTKLHPNSENNDEFKPTSLPNMISQTNLIRSSSSSHESLHKRASDKSFVYDESSEKNNISNVVESEKKQSEIKVHLINKKTVVNRPTTVMESKKSFSTIFVAFLHRVRARRNRKKK